MCTCQEKKEEEKIVYDRSNPKYPISNNNGENNDDRSTMAPVQL